MQLLCNQDDLGQHQCVENSESVRREVDVMLGEDYDLINGNRDNTTAR